MNVITQNLDILNIFKKLFLDEKIQEKLKKEKDDSIKMSDECINNLSSVNKACSSS